MKCFSLKMFIMFNYFLLLFFVNKKHSVYKGEKKFFWQQFCYFAR